MFTPDTAKAKARLRELAIAIGFDAVAFTTPTLARSAQSGLETFLQMGHHGEMSWMEEKKERRVSPGVLWPDAASIMVVGQNYAPAGNPLENLASKNAGTISCYAQNEDYHDVVKKRLKQLASAIVAEFGCDVKVFVDTAPVMEKPLAQQAGLGWQGKHTCVVSREFGAWLFLGEIFLSISVPPDAPEPDHCGTCTRCLDICPTQAFNGPHEIDARRCISYLTIEHASHIDIAFRASMGNRIYGCDDCLAVCPWNKFAKTAREAAFHPRSELTTPLLSELAALDDAAFRSFFRKSPVKRIGRDRFVRNVLIAIGNSGNVSHIPLITLLLKDCSVLVRAMAVWSLSQLASADECYTLRQAHLALETDESIINEWNR